MNIIRDFPKSIIGEVSQTGHQLGERKQGVTISLYGKNGVPTYAEVYSTEDGGLSYYVDIGLTIEDGVLVDYDGVFEIPNELLSMLRELSISHS